MTIPRAAQLSQVSPSIYDLVKCRGDEWCISSNGRHTQSRGESSVFFVQTMTTTLQLPQPTPTLIPLSTLLNFTTCSFDFIIARYLSTHFYVSLASGWSVLIASLEQKKTSLPIISLQDTDGADRKSNQKYTLHLTSSFCCFSPTPVDLKMIKGVHPARL